MAGSEKHRFVVLDGMRGLAALCVILDHVNSPLLSGATPGRYLAVDFFFALSGFVLAHGYGERLGSGMTALEFVRVRLVRLYPLYLVGTLMTIALAGALVLKGWSHEALGDIAMAAGFALLFLPSPTGYAQHHGNAYPFDGPAWSLFFELFVNALFALVFTKLTMRVLAVILLISGAALIVSGFWYGQLDGGFAWSNFAGGFPRVIYAFFAGVLIYRLYQTRKLPALPAWAAFAALLTIFVIPATGTWRTLFDLSAAMVLFPALVAVSANAKAGGKLGALAAAMGGLSYGIYILHVPIRDWLHTVETEFLPHVTVPGALQALMVASLAIIAAAVLDRIYDTPVRRWLSRPRAKAAA